MRIVADMRGVLGRKVVDVSSDTEQILKKSQVNAL